MKSFLLFLFFSTISIIAYGQTTYYVNKTATGSNNGTSWANAYTNLQSAMDAASAGDAIWIAAGTYLPTEAPDGSNTNSRDRAFHLNKNLTIYGGFIGTETMLSQRDWETNSTLLSGDFSGDDVVSGSGSSLVITNNGENAYHVFITSGLNSTTLIDGLTIQGGNANGAAFSNISYDGNNISKRSGGGMNNFFSSPRISNSNFNGNAADFGGGMDNEGSSPRISNTSFSRNTANSNGGGMQNFNSSPNISNTSFSGNSADYGGGIFNHSSSPSITNTSFSGNAATNDGGGMYNFSSPGSSISNTSISGNTANRGGGMYNSNSFPIVNNTVFYENTAATDPDIFGNIDSISSNNASDRTGGGIGSGTGFIDLSSVASTTLFVNVADADGPDDVWRTADDGLIPAAASPLTNTGSNTLLPTDATDLDNDGDVSEVIPYDSTGVPRIFDGTVDVGAYETVPPCVRVNRLYVNVAATGNNTGESWVNAFTDLQAAMDCATAGKEIWVAAGTYLPTDAPDGTTSGGLTDRNNAFHLNKNLKIYGGFVGGETMLSQRDWEANPTILSGDFSGNDTVSGSGSSLVITNNGENAYHVFITSGLNSTTLIDGFTVKGGNAAGSGIISYDGKSYSRGSAGGMINNLSSPSISNITFSENAAANFGGGMYNLLSSPSFSNTTFSRNTVIAGSGGGMINEVSSPSISNSTFSGNRASNNGAGMYNYSSFPIINTTTFSRNTAGFDGGGMYNYESYPSVINSTFSRNEASYGGGMNNDSSSPKISNTTFNENTTSFNGGGMFNSSSATPTINNTVFYENTAATDPDIFGNNIHSSSAHNASDGTGGGINSGTGFIDLSGVASSTLFVNPADPDGPDDIWRTADDGLIPAAGSPLTDTGSNILLPADITDLDSDNDTSETLPFDSTGGVRIQGGTVDVGAYELVPPPTDIQIDGANTDSINENRLLGARIGRFTTTDASLVDSHSYALVAGAGDTNNASFSIKGDELFTNAVFDFETKTSYSIRVQTTDSTGSTYTESLTIRVNNITTEADTAGVKVWDLNTPANYTASLTTELGISTGIGQVNLGIFTARDIGLDTGNSLGVFITDLNGDGYLDIYVANSNNQQNKLWINSGTASFTALDIPGDLGFSLDASIADFNGDGHLDIYTVNANNQQNKLWINSGTASFTAQDISGDMGESRSTSIADLNGDGYLDIYVVNGSNQQNKLWINDGTASFTAMDITGDMGESRSTSIADLNGDGYLDIYVANDQQNKLWINSGTASFTALDISGDNGLSYGSSIADLNGDGYLDIYVANIGQQNNLWINSGTASFTAMDITGDTGNSTAASIKDLNGDGYLDVYVANNGQQNKLWINSGSASFTAMDITGDIGNSFDASISDLNGDGFLDIYVANFSQQNKLWLNSFASSSPFVSPSIAQAFSTTVNSFTEILSANSSGTTSYQVSTDNGSTWQYWNGTTWSVTTQTDGTETSSATTINTNIQTLDTDGGVFTWRAFLTSDGAQRVELDQVDIQYETQLPPIIEQCSTTLIPPSILGCSGTVTATTTDPLTYTSQGTYTLNWMFSCAGASSAIATQTLVIKDTTSPVVPALSNITAQCSTTVTTPTAMDNCSGVVTATTSDTTVITSQGTSTILWIFTDEAGNSSSATQTVFIQDTTPPVLPVLTQINAVGSITLTVPTTLDNCSGLVTGTTSDSLSYSSPGTYTVSWTFTDTAGNSSTTSQMVLVTAVPPVSVTPPTTTTTPTTTGGGGGSSPKINIPELKAITLNCGEIIPTATTSDTSGNEIEGTRDSSLPLDIGTNTILWSFTNRGKTVTAAQVVTVVDQTAPLVPELETLSDACGLTVSTPTAIDACEGDIQGTTDNSLTYDLPGTYSILWSFTDSQGNRSQATQIVEITYLNEIIDTIESCEPYTWIDGISYTASNNSARYEEIDSEGCTLLHYLDLTLTDIDTTISLNGTSLTANEFGASYQWIDCNNGNTPIAGATEQSFTPTKLSGNYAVRITRNDCEVISECLEFMGDGMPLVAEGISPNGDGDNDIWMIEGIENFPKARVTVYNTLGKDVFTALNGYNNDWRGDFNNSGDPLPSGPYFYTIDLDADGEIDQQGWLYIQN